MIRHFKYLRFLTIVNVPLMQFESNYLNGLDEFYYLKISGINKESTDHLKLNQTNNIIILELEYDHIKYLDRESFSMLKNVEKLSLRRNEISFLDEKIFQSMKYLKNLI